MIILVVFLIFILIFFSKDRLEYFQESNSNYVLFNKNSNYILIDINKKLEVYKNPLVFETYSEYKIYSKQNDIPIISENTNIDLPNWLTTLLKDTNEEESNEEELIQEELIEEELITNDRNVNQDNKINEWLNNNRINLNNKNTNSNTNNKSYFKKPITTTYSEYGYNYMPSTTWSVPQQRPPVCINNNKCPICPLVDRGTPINALELNHEIGSILPKFSYNEDENYFYPGWSTPKQSNYPSYNSNYSMSQKFEPT